MQHTPPNAPSIAAAIPLAAPAIVVPGWDIRTLPDGVMTFIDLHRESVPAFPPMKAKKAKLTRAERKSFVDAIPDDFPAPAKPAQYVAPPTCFEHKPLITLYRDGKDSVVTGPVEPALPAGTPATRIGWEKYSVDAPEAIRVSQAERDAFNRVISNFFDERKATEEAAFTKRCDRAHRAGKPIPERPEREAPPANWMTFIKDPELLAMYGGAQCNRKLKRRLEAYHHKQGLLADRHVKEFTEKFEGCNAIRTALRILSLQLFNSSLPKASALVFGFDKTAVFNESQMNLGPMFVRDMPYIETDRSRRCLFPVDMDGWWPSIEALRADLRRFLPEDMMPNIIAYRADTVRGGVSNPHLLFVLPPGSRVIWGKGKKKKQQFKLADMIRRAIVSHLIPLGADPDHHNYNKIKNPLSAAWSIACFDGHFATMDDWRRTLPTILTNYREMKRRSKIHRATPEGGDVTESNLLWTDGIVARRVAIRSAQKTKDPAFLASLRTHAEFCVWLEAAVTERMLAAHGASEALRSVIAAQMECVRDLNKLPTASGSWSDRGRDSYLNGRESTLSWDATAEERKFERDERKSRAGTQSRADAMRVNKGLIAEEIEKRLSAGDFPTKAEVVKALVAAGTVSRSVAYARFDYCLDVVLQAARYQAHTATSKSLNPSLASNQHPATQSDPASGNQIAAPVDGEPVNGPSKTHNPAEPSTRPAVQRPVVSDPAGERAYIVRGSWAAAVAAWRAARKPLPNEAAATSAMLHSSAWSGSRH